MRAVRKLRLYGIIGVILALAMITTACAGEGGLEEDGGEAQGGGNGGGGTVVVGSANFTEQFILGNMYAQVLENAGVTVETQLNVGPREVVFPAVESGEIDLVPEYTGALTSFVTGGEVTTTELVSILREELAPDIEVLEPAPAQDQDALAVTQDTAEQYDLETVEDLAPVAGELTACGPPEEKTRNVGLPGLKEVYNVEFGDFIVLDAGGPRTVAALENGDCDVGRVFTTQGVIDQKNFVVLEETKPLIPAENIIPVIRSEALTPEIEDTLNELSSNITTEALTKLNAQVEVDKEDPEEVARTWLEDEGLL
jgi:osmoprotectant transport system substrate-binding protein